ncbi:MAG TPA: YdcF family protein [Propionicimonas sp.]|nr:YdcF family protein [Propionicimonas sp.]
MFAPTLSLVLLAVILIDWYYDPRKYRIGLMLTALVAWLLLSVAFWLIERAQARGDRAGALVLLAVLGMVVATVIAFAGFLVVTGITLLRREGISLSRGLSLGLGLVLLGYVALGAWVVWSQAYGWLVVVLLLGLPAGYLGFAFVAFLLYGSLYPALMARIGGPVTAVVVLGSGLVRGRVPPLLASRLRRGRQVFDEARASGVPVQLVTSGGQGADEPVAEAVAMADFLVGAGVPAESVIVEDKSRTTAENLANTKELLAGRGLDGAIAVVTSDFHAFRGALIMRRLGIPGYSVGARTARYYWPSAVIREFIAVLRDHFRLNVILLGLACLPLLIWAGYWVTAG